MDKKEMQKAREVAMVTNRKGWDHIEDFIKNKKKPLEDKLFNDDLDKEQFKIIQGKRQSLQEILVVVKLNFLLIML